LHKRRSEEIMNRSIKLCVTSLVLGLAAVACDKTAQQDQDKVNQAQQTANDKIAQAQSEAQTKITSAQVAANQDIAAANADFMKMRESYRHDVQTNLIDEDSKIQKLDDRERTLTAQKRTDLDTSLADISLKRATFINDINALDQSTAATWDAAKAKTDQAWSDLKGAVDKATPVL
jgi:hypothetical protein